MSYFPRAVVDCGTLPEVMNGIVTHEDTVYQSTAMYMCNSGFTLTDGNRQRTCGINGDWTGEEPTCSKLFQCQYIIMSTVCTHSYWRKFMATFH